MCTDYLYILQKRVHRNHHIFHFFQTIASCDHQLTSECQLVRPFSLLFAILMFSYDFDNVIFCKFIYFDNYILFCTNPAFRNLPGGLFPHDFFSTPRTVVKLLRPLRMLNFAFHPLPCRRLVRAYFACLVSFVQRDCLRFILEIFVYFQNSGFFIFKTQHFRCVPDYLHILQKWDQNHHIFSLFFA